MVRKTQEVDRLLNRIADSLDEGVKPALEDLVQLEWLRLEYLDCEDRTKLLPELGLRYRSKKAKQHQTPKSHEYIHEIIYKAQYVVPEESLRKKAIEIIRNYTAGHSSATAMFGERERKDWQGFSWQERDILGGFVTRMNLDPDVKVIIKKRRKEEQDKYYNIYSLLEQVSGSDPELGGYPDLQHVRKMLEAQINEFSKFKSQLSPINRRFSKDSWKECYRTYKKY